ncbi:MarR family transcriptional regulator [Arthrobacter sp. zg-Y20]|uniref:MarR family winged helix-turn-helix transcriptional regulator n=1 Tax=unclassified Arthrobacter TaxID=235627 RepID=UPI001D134F65|nr:MULTISPECIES: MarR family transcriptional regulator [unclassified Arthrobacter]MCC3276436.1 MarR family transcriptional regulator [Arthrobacter sp. zg-Y20]MDK1316595.1 MarR family transcriptional regulator [Arthrobacter sp. zg.Y20]WIB06634.1 MarR family transcriptional regulator [Arthrobacter sp. zg-Y20]
MTGVEQQERTRILRALEDITDSLQSSALSSFLDPLLATDLTVRQLKVLTVLVTIEEGATGSGLAQSFGVSMASMSGLVDRLVAQGVAVRSEDPVDARVRRVKATPWGRTVVRRLVAGRPELNSDILDRLPLADLQALEQGLRAISAEVTRRAHATG